MLSWQDVRLVATWPPLTPPLLVGRSTGFLRRTLSPGLCMAPFYSIVGPQDIRAVSHLTNMRNARPSPLAAEDAHADADVGMRTAADLRAKLAARFGAPPLPSGAKPARSLAQSVESCCAPHTHMVCMAMLLATLAHSSLCTWAGHRAITSTGAGVGIPMSGVSTRRPADDRTGHQEIDSFARGRLQDHPRHVGQTSAMCRCISGRAIWRAHRKTTLRQSHEVALTIVVAQLPGGRRALMASWQVQVASMPR